MLTIRKCTIAEMEASPNIRDLLDEYASESSIKDLPHPFAKVDTYKYLETTKAIDITGAFIDNLLVGFIITLAPILPHYSARVAVVESFFVSKEYRSFGAGLKLRRAAKDYATNAGAIGILYSAPVGSILAELLEKSKECTETSRVFFERLNHE